MAKSNINAITAVFSFSGTMVVGDVQGTLFGGGYGYSTLSGGGGSSLTPDSIDGVQIRYLGDLNARPYARLASQGAFTSLWPDTITVTIDGVTETGTKVSTFEYEIGGANAFGLASKLGQTVNVTIADPNAAPTSNLKAYDGSAFVPAKTVRVHNGSTFVTAKQYSRWNGTEWTPLLLPAALPNKAWVIDYNDARGVSIPATTGNISLWFRLYNVSSDGAYLFDTASHSHRIYMTSGLVNSSGVSNVIIKDINGDTVTGTLLPNVDYYLTCDNTGDIQAIGGRYANSSRRWHGQIWDMKIGATSYGDVLLQPDKPTIMEIAPNGTIVGDVDPWIERTGLIPTNLVAVVPSGALINSPTTLSVLIDPLVTNATTLWEISYDGSTWVTQDVSSELTAPSGYDIQFTPVTQGTTPIFRVTVTTSYGNLTAVSTAVDIVGLVYTELPRWLGTVKPSYNSTIQAFARLGDIIFAGANSSNASNLGRSTDNGVTWSPINVLAPSGFRATDINTITAHNDTVMVGDNSEGFIYHSNDKGLTWDVYPRFVPSGSSYAIQTIHKQLNQPAWVIGMYKGYSYRTADGGTTWDSLPKHLNAIPPEDLPRPSSIAGSIYAICESDGRTVAGLDEGFTSYSNDGGNTWNDYPRWFNNVGASNYVPVNGYSTSADVNTIAANGRVFIAGMDGGYASRIKDVNNVNEWYDLPRYLGNTEAAAYYSVANKTDAHIFALVFHNNIVIAGMDGGFSSISFDYGETWTALQRGWVHSGSDTNFIRALTSTNDPLKFIASFNLGYACSIELGGGVIPDPVTTEEFLWIVQFNDTRVFKYSTFTGYTGDNFVSNDGWAEGLVHSGVNFYESGNAGKTINKLDENGALIIKYDVSANVSVIAGIHTDGTNIWVVDSLLSNTRVYKYTMDGAYTGESFAVAEGSSGASPFGITGDGLYLWVGFSNGKVLQYSMAGVATGVEFDTTAQDAFTKGLTWSGTHFWIGGGNTNKVYKYTNAGVYTGVFIDTSAEGSRISGVTIL